VGESKSQPTANQSPCRWRHMHSIVRFPLLSLTSQLHLFLHLAPLRPPLPLSPPSTLVYGFSAFDNPLRRRACRRLDLSARFRFCCRCLSLPKLAGGEGQQQRHLDLDARSLLLWHQHRSSLDSIPSSSLSFVDIICRCRRYSS
jgi:hypothetical protein